MADPNDGHLTNSRTGQGQMYKPLSSEEEQHRKTYLCDTIVPTSSTAALVMPLSLPFFHTCKGKAFRSIFTSRRLALSICPEFNEDLLYLFYGKPAYRVPSSGLSSRDMGRFPVCFVIENNHVSGVKRVFPFDTGALINNILKDVCGDENNPAKYELGSDLYTIMNFIGFFYGSDKNYFHCKPRIKLDDIAGFSFELQHIYALATETSEKKWDNRAYTVETQCSDHIEFKKDTISAVILPSFYMNTTEIVDFFFNEGIEPIPYSLDRADPGHMSPFLIGLAEDYLKKKGVL